MRKVSGFTLIELIVVIAILAILAATAIPRFIDLRTDALRATLGGMAGALASGTAVNYAGRLANNPSATAVSTCAASSLTLAGNTGISFVFQGGATTAGGGQATACTITMTDQGTTVTAIATIIGAS